MFVDDLVAAQAFYGDVLKLKTAWQLEGIAVGDDLGLTLILETVPADADAEERALVGRFCGLSFEVDDIDATYAELRTRGVEFTDPPTRQDWGGCRDLAPADGSVTTLNYNFHGQNSNFNNFPLSKTQP